MEEQYLTAQEVATRLKVDVNTVYNWLGGNPPKLRGVHAGGLWRIPVSALEDFLKPNYYPKTEIVH